jgi:hypothetical protein
VRTVLRVALAVVVLAAASAAALGWWLSGYVESESFQARLREAVHEATGQEPSWAALEVGVFPPRVRVEQAKLGDGGALAVERANLRVALLPLVAGAVVVDRVSIEGGVLRAVRSADGVRWPWQGPEGGEAPAPGASPRARGGAEANVPGAGGFDLAVRRFDLSGTRFTLEDRTVEPPVELVLADVAARARPRGGDALGFSGSARLGEGGVRGEGEIDAAGALAVTIVLERLPAATFASYLGDDARLGGALDGTLALRGPARSPDAAELDVRVGDAAIEIGDAAIRGPVTLKAELRGPLDRPAGSFVLDATGAELVYGGGILRKPPGAAASAEGRIATAPDGRIDAEQVRVRMKDIGGQGSLGAGGGRPLAAALDAPPFALAGIGDLVPALAPLAPEGSAALEGVRVSTPPLALAGRVVLDGARVRPAGRGPIVLRGALVGAGAGLRSEGLVAEAGGQPARLELAVTGLDGAPRHHTRIALEDADAQPLLAALTGEPEALTGPLTVSADLAGPLAGGDAALAGLSGSARLAAGPGRIPGVAPFQMAVEQLEKTIGGLGDRRRERLRQFYGDRFESLTGHFSVAGGVARSDDLVLRYPGYALELAGTVRLVDRALDARGRLVLEEEAYAALAGEEPEPGGRQRVVPLAAVRGTLDEPRVAIDPQAAIALAATFATAGKRGKLERQIDGVLGKGAGRGVLDAIDGLLAPREPRR